MRIYSKCLINSLDGQGRDCMQRKAQQKVTLGYKEACCTGSKSNQSYSAAAASTCPTPPYITADMYLDEKTCTPCTQR